MGSTKKATKNQLLAIKNLIEKRVSLENITGTNNHKNCNTTTNTIGFRHHHSGSIFGLCAYRSTNINKNIHMIGSSGSEVENEVPNKYKCMEMGMLNKKIQYVNFQFSKVIAPINATKGKSKKA